MTAQKCFANGLTARVIPSLNEIKKGERNQEVCKFGSYRYKLVFQLVIRYCAFDRC
jgi:hypothetical protein